MPKLYKWWGLQHISGGPWVPMKVMTIFGYPLTTVLFRVVGPSKTLQRCRYDCLCLNELYAEYEQEEMERRILKGIPR